MRNIVLIGLSGSGKTTLGKRLAEKYRMPFIDTDAQIEQQYGAPIGTIFENLGEAAFRDMESDALAVAAALGGAIISTGGGAVLRARNVDTLKRTGVLVFLDRNPDAIMADIDCTNRPLLASGRESMRIMAKERRPIYEKAADLIFNNDLPEEKAFDALVALLSKNSVCHTFAVIGDPIAHSLSPIIHQAIFDTIGFPACYQATHVPKEALVQFVASVREGGVEGFNVTRPNKQAIIPLLDAIDEDAAACGAVNTVVKRDGQLYGYNTDMQGLLQALNAHGCGYQGKNIALLGAGGAASGIVFKAAREGAKQITLYARRPAQAQEVQRALDRASTTQVLVQVLEDAVLTEDAPVWDLLINATPLGMAGMQQDFESLAFMKKMQAHCVVCDLVYAPPQTLLLGEAQNLGLTCFNGLDMLIHQAILADELYLDKKLDAASCYQAVYNKLKSVTV